jgi:2-keto-4-pentenoate hydratase/2-oxohepta-3-ene-1,7-dioic acid hydratase in catechol pathway
VHLASVAGRICTFVDGELIDIERTSQGYFSSNALDAFDRWDELVSWGRSVGANGAGEVPAGQLGPPVPTPRQVFGVGLNYQEHAAEAALDAPALPPVFTKFPSCIVGQNQTVEIRGNTVDWEVELVCVIGDTGYRISVDDAWRHVAGLTIGQDLSDRARQLSGTMPQFSMGKSLRGFGPIGPWLVTPDALTDPDDLAISCAVDGEEVQQSRTSEMIFPVADLIEQISAVCQLMPGDLIFTGTPAGVGYSRSPQRFLKPGQVITSTIERIGTLTTTLV